MKKKICACFSLMVLCVSLLFAACSFSNDKLSGVDYDYAVSSNGGSAVQMGNFVYFVNGYEDYSDSDGKQNVWGEVVKGGIYRAELIGNSKQLRYYDSAQMEFVEPAGVKDFEIKVEDSAAIDKDLDFVSHADVDYDEEPIDVISVQRLVPKKIRDLNNRGIFIYDGFIYYATPNNLRDKSGVFRSEYTSFMRTSLDGKKTTLIYTSENSEVDYSVYHENGITYLVVLDGSNLKSFGMNAKKVVSKTILSENVTKAVFADREQWYKGIGINNVENFIFYTRTQQEDDLIQSGNTVEMIRPSGNNKTQLIQNRNEITLERVKDGLLFYKQGTNLMYTDCAAELIEITGEAPYKTTAALESIRTKEGVALGSIDSWASVFVRRGTPHADTVEVWAFSEAEVRYFENGINGVVVLDTGADLVHFDDAQNQLYFSLKSDANTYRTLYRTDARLAASAKEEVYTQALKLKFKHEFFKVDFAAGHAFFVVESLDEWAKDYTFVTRAVAQSDEKESFIGVRKEADVKPEDEDAE